MIRSRRNANDSIEEGSFLQVIKQPKLYKTGKDDELLAGSCRIRAFNISADPNRAERYALESLNLTRSDGRARAVPAFTANRRGQKRQTSKLPRDLVGLSLFAALLGSGCGQYRAAPLGARLHTAGWAPYCWSSLLCPCWLNWLDCDLCWLNCDAGH